MGLDKDDLDKLKSDSLKLHTSPKSKSTPALTISKEEADEILGKNFVYNKILNRLNSDIKLQNILIFILCCVLLLITTNCHLIASVGGDGVTRDFRITGTPQDTYTYILLTTVASNIKLAFIVFPFPE